MTDPAGQGRSQRIYQAASASHVGRVREENQDDCLVRSDIGLWAVADGVGGLSDGRHASRTVVDALAQVTRPASLTDLQQRLETAVARANTQLVHFAQARHVSLGTTLVALLIHQDAYVCAWAGDSRAYLLRAGRIALLTEDHTEANALIRQGVLTPAEALTWPRRNVITRAIGVEGGADLDVRAGVVQDDDVFVLCSDGLTAHLSDSDIMDTLKGHAHRPGCGPAGGGNAAARGEGQCHGDRDWCVTAWQCG